MSTENNDIKIFYNFGIFQCCCFRFMCVNMCSVGMCVWKRFCFFSSLFYMLSSAVSSNDICKQHDKFKDKKYHQTIYFMRKYAERKLKCRLYEKNKHSITRSYWQFLFALSSLIRLYRSKEKPEKIITTKLTFIIWWWKKKTSI